jgi:hypothetical protein
VETTETFTISELGQNTGKPYDGKFVIKTILSRRDAFAADERRRMIIGVNPSMVMPALSGEAYMLGQLFVHIIEAPKWWLDSDRGLDIEDENIIGVLYKLVEEKSKEKRDQIQANAKSSLEKLAKSAKKIGAKEE